jgi:hypothetical protein
MAAQSEAATLYTVYKVRDEYETLRNAILCDMIPHGVTSQKTAFFTVNAVKTSNIN